MVNPDAEKLPVNRPIKLFITPIAALWNAILCDLSQGRPRMVVPAAHLYTTFHAIHNEAHPAIRLDEASDPVFRMVQF